MNRKSEVFDAFYLKDDLLPEDFISRIEPDVIQGFKSGKEFVFQDLKFNFPKIYDFLIKEMSDLMVVRIDGGSIPFYHWALTSDFFNIYAAVSKTFRKIKQKRSERDYYEVLPDYLKPFYYFFDGFDCSNKKGLSLHESGFLLSFSNWYGMKDIIEYSAIGEAGCDEFIEKFLRSDIRIILRQESGKVAFIDKSKTLDGIWVGMWGELGECQKVDDPISFFNDCFFETVNSFKG